MWRVASCVLVASAACGDAPGVADASVSQYDADPMWTTIDNRGFPDGAAKHTTGAIYNVDDQAFTRVSPRPVGEWNDFVLRAVGQTYTVLLNGAQTTRFDNPDPARGAAAPAFIGLQTHPAPGTISYRNIRIRAL